MLLMVPLAALGLQTVTATVFVLAGCTKLANPAPISRTVAALGIPRSSVVAAALGSLEVGAGLALVLVPGRWFTALWIAALAVVFGGAAGLAIVRNVRVECACLGSTASAPLGWRQLGLTVVWLGTSASVVTVPVGLPADRIAITFIVVALIAILELIRLIPLVLEHRAQRVAIEGS